MISPSRRCRAVDVYNSTSFSLMCACPKRSESIIWSCAIKKLVREMLDWRATSAAAELQFNKKNFYALFFIAQTCPYFIMNLTQSSDMQQNRDAMISSVYNILFFFILLETLSPPFVMSSFAFGFRYVCVKCEIQLANSPKLTWGFRFTSSWYQHEKQHINSLYAVALIAFALQKRTALLLPRERLKWGSKTQSESPLDWTVAFVHIDSAILPASTLCGERKVVEHNWKSKRIKRFHE